MDCATSLITVFQTKRLTKLPRVRFDGTPATLDKLSQERIKTGVGVNCASALFIYLFIYSGSLLASNLLLDFENMLSIGPFFHHVRLEVASLYTSQEHRVQLIESSAFCFWQCEETPNQTWYRQSKKDKRKLSLEIALVGVDGIWDADSAGDIDQSVDGRGDSDGLAT